MMKDIASKEDKKEKATNEKRLATRAKHADVNKARRKVHKQDQRAAEQKARIEDTHSDALEYHLLYDLYHDVAPIYGLLDQVSLYHDMLTDMPLVQECAAHDKVVWALDHILFVETQQNTLWYWVQLRG